jgi:uncharacterized membrane protein YoaT (DUF817 family)
MQTKRASLIEVLTGTFVGLLIAIAAGQWWIYPAFGLHPTLGKNLYMTLAFTAVGLVRSYVWRRLFNWIGK